MLSLLWLLFIFIVLWRWEVSFRLWCSFGVYFSSSLAVAALVIVVICFLLRRWDCCSKIRMISVNPRGTIHCWFIITICPVHTGFIDASLTLLLNNCCIISSSSIVLSSFVCWGRRSDFTNLAALFRSFTMTNIARLFLSSTLRSISLCTASVISFILT